MENKIKNTITVLFPIDLYNDTSYIKDTKVFLVEEEHYFNRSDRSLGSMHFNVLKPVYHRATMKSYYDELKNKGIGCTYVELKHDWIKIVKKHIHPDTTLRFFDPVDRYIESKLNKNFESYNIINTPRFILTTEDLLEYDGALKQTSFYMWIRKKKNILIDKNGEFYGKKVTYDTENRKKPYSGIENDLDDSLGSKIDFTKNKYVVEAFRYVKKTIKSSDLTIWSDNGLKIDDYDNLSDTDLKLKFPIDTKNAKFRLNYFIKNKLDMFGDYQDAFLDTDDDNSSFIFHSGLSVMINIGLITPEDVIDSVIKHFNALSISVKNKQIHNVEGFIRQILGWREFTRFVYQHHSDKYLNKNYFNADQKLTKEWYSGTTNIPPIDLCIKKAFKYGYLHHIERLMVVANFMTLSGINPKLMYKWFMEFSLDSYDWVMEFNIYSMGSYSDAGTFTSKPYISGSNYLLKMSNYDKNDDWINIWDLMFWQFMLKHKNKLKKVGRLSMLIGNAKKRVDEIKKEIKDNE
jgi:deoxyribodipyrimidine photolyase-related protein